MEDLKVRQFSDVIGQTRNKNILKELKRSDRIVDIMFFVGKSGSGKSTLAELFAMAATCEKGETEPCLECETCKSNLRGLNSQSSKSKLIKKINMAELIAKKEVKDIIEQVFDLEPVRGKKTFYIFEELQDLKDYQGMFLERFRDLPEGVHIIGCTTNIKALDEPFRTRAKLTLVFNALDVSECRTLVQKLCTANQITNLTQQDLELLIMYSKQNARVITNTLSAFKNFPNIQQILRDYLNIMAPELYINMLKSLFKDFTSFISDLDTLDNSVDLLDFHDGLSNFLLESVFYYQCGRATIFTKQEKSGIKEIFSSLNVKQVRKLLKLSFKKCPNEDSVKELIIEMQEVVDEKPITRSRIIEEAVIENTVAQRAQENLKQEKIETQGKLKAITLEDLTLETKSMNGFKVQSSEWDEEE